MLYRKIRTDAIEKKKWANAKEKDSGMCYRGIFQQMLSERIRADAIRDNFGQMLYKEIFGEML